MNSDTNGVNFVSYSGSLSINFSSANIPSCIKPSDFSKWFWIRLSNKLTLDEISLLLASVIVSGTWIDKLPRQLYIMIQAAKIIGTGLATSGLIGAGVGIGIGIGALILGVARNPSLRGQLFSYAILGFAFAEATGLFALMMAFLLLYVA